MLRSAKLALLAFAKCSRGGAMLLMGAMGMTLLTGLGALMTNYSWREAQDEELRAALRAAVSSASQLLPLVTQPEVQESIKERVAGVLGGLTPGLKVSSDDVDISYETATGITRISIGGQAQYQYQNLWGSQDEDSAVQLPRQTVAVTVDVSRYETVVAADISDSMTNKMETGKDKTRLDALKDALGVAIDIMEDASQDNTGTVTIGLVPFGSAVNVGDTSGSNESAGKRRFAHLLGGGAHDSSSAATGDHWVDTFHHYGNTGESWGTDLQTRTLPVFETTKSWNLRGNVDIDLADEAPGLGTWSVERRDFWNGCVMARWGAYWDEDARPAACTAGCQRQCDDSDSTCTACAEGCWHEDMSENIDLWPVRADVDAWTPLSTALAAEPLHLSDAPPDASHPNSRFTAYSWPDAGVSGSTDARLHGALLETLEPGALTRIEDVRFGRGGDNIWSNAESSGDWYCPPNPIEPLTENAANLRTVNDALTVIPTQDNAYGGTYLHLGVVWGLRVLSPLWRDIWATTDDAGAARPLTPCAAGETGAHCSQFVQKMILLITDGQSGIGRASLPATPDNDSRRGRVIRDNLYELLGEARANPGNLAVDAGKICQHFKTASDSYANAVADTSEATFNSRFADLDASGRFAGNSLDRVVDAFEKSMETSLPNASRNLLAGVTPWELFRNLGYRNDETNLTDVLMAQSGDFGFDGRPVYDDMACRLNSSFGPYGRIDDFVQVGGRPVEGVAPFSKLSGNLANAAKTRLDDWLMDSCAIAKERGVEVKIIYLSLANPPESIRNTQDAHIETLRQCVDEAGGDRNTDVYESPTTDNLTSTFREIFTVRRNLRFLN